MWYLYGGAQNVDGEDDGPCATDDDCMGDGVCRLSSLMTETSIYRQVFSDALTKTPVKGGSVDGRWSRPVLRLQ